MFLSYVCVVQVAAIAMSRSLVHRRPTGCVWYRNLNNEAV